MKQPPKDLKAKRLEKSMQQDLEKMDIPEAKSLAKHFTSLFFPKKKR